MKVPVHPSSDTGPFFIVVMYGEQGPTLIGPYDTRAQAVADVPHQTPPCDCPVWVKSAKKP